MSIRRFLLIGWGLLLWVVLLALLQFSLAQASASECPNEALRLELGSSHLPDCRAYELVTPSFKAGAALQPLGLSRDGSRMVVQSTAVTGGVEGDGLNAYYQATRSALGWLIDSINPASALLPAQELMAASQDETRTLWRARHGEQPVYAQDAYLREPNGTFVEVGPLVPPSLDTGPPAGEFQAFVGDHVFRTAASSDLSHFFFEPQGEGALWPGDTTQHRASARSLYEYVGTGNARPELVGANTEGTLLSDCGIALGSIGPGTSYSENDLYNALSANGDTVFFTVVGHSAGSECEASISAPEANELYARIGTFPVDTVSISEPSEAACEVCQTGVATFNHPKVPEQPAEFQGASEDGSKVFFVTSQELFAGDTGPNLFEYDFDNPAGQKVLRVSRGSAEPKVLGVARVSADGSHVYFVAEGVLAGANKENLAPSPVGPNLYVFERDSAFPSGRTTFIRTLATADSQDWSPIDSRPVQATPDGRFVVFDSVADLTPGDTSSATQVFEYDTETEELVRVSVGEAGYPEGQVAADENFSFITTQGFTEFLEPAASTTSIAVSADGADVAFASRGALTREAVVAAGAHSASVYEYRSSGALGDGRVFQISGGHNTADAEAFGLTNSGADLFIRTPEPLLASDVDTQFDVYDARVDGGFVPSVEPAECVATLSCQGDISPGTVLGGGGEGTAGVPGGGNFSAPPPAAHQSPPPPVTRQQLLAKALRVCRREHPRRRQVTCEAQARKRYRSEVRKAGSKTRKAGIKSASSVQRKSGRRS